MKDLQENKGEAEKLSEQEVGVFNSIWYDNHWTVSDKVRHARNAVNYARLNDGDTSHLES